MAQAARVTDELAHVTRGLRSRCVLPDEYEARCAQLGAQLAGRPGRRGARPWGPASSRRDRLAAVAATRAQLAELRRGGLPDRAAGLAAYLSGWLSRLEAGGRR